MIAGSFALGISIITFALMSVLDSRIGLFPFAFPHFEDIQSIIVIGLAFVVYAVIFRIPTKE